MPALADLERLLERVFERTTARLFRARPQVVQVEHKVERAMERARAQQGAWTVVPSRYRVRLNPDDLTALAADTGGAEALAARLADAALAFARSHDYHLSGRPSVALVADPAVERAEIEVDAVADRGRVAAEAGPEANADPMGHNVPDMPVVAPRGQEPAGQAPAVVTPVDPVLDQVLDSAGDPQQPVAQMPETAAPASAQSSAPASGSIRREATETLVFRKPSPPEARAVLRLTAADGKERLVEVGGAPVTIGRSTDNGLVLPDARISRHHGRLQSRRGTLVYTDLGSTNGSRVNGVRVDECALGMGDRIVVGDTVLLVEQLPA